MVLILLPPDLCIYVLRGGPLLLSFVSGLLLFIPAFQLIGLVRIDEFLLLAPNCVIIITER